MSDKSHITKEYLHSILDYDPKTGIFVWLKRPVDMFRDGEGRYTKERNCKIWNKRFAGEVAGTIYKAKNKDYYCIQININTKLMKAHQLAWFMMTGEWLEEIDHDNNNSLDNRWCNLRKSTRSQQNQNRRSNRGRSLPKGVTLNKNTGKFFARIKTPEKHIRLGTFDCPAAASFAYQVAADIHFGEFARAF